MRNFKKHGFVKKCSAGVLALALLCSAGTSVHAETTSAKEWDRAAVLVDKVADEDANIMVSPLSLDIALAMTGNGAQDTTKKELVNYLGRSIKEYNQLAKTKYSEDAKELKVANSIWVTKDRGYELRNSFVSKLKDNYRAKITNVNFGTTKTTNAINKWVKNKTGDMIPKIVDKTDKKTRMMLINALYFDSKWANKFSANNTADSEFTNSKGKQLTVPFLNGGGDYYYKNEKAQGFGKLYENGRYEFIAILPEQEGDFELSDLGLDSLKESQNSSITVNVKIPKFTFAYETKDKLKPILKELGVRQAFSNSARFEKMLVPDTKNRLKIDKVLQKTKIVVDEDGTKAAAATVVDMVKATGAGPRESVTVVLDRPFAFFIYDTEADTVLFAGKVNTIK